MGDNSINSGIRVGDDGRARCAWAGDDPLYLAYHDQEWGRPVHGEQALYERICLEAFQSGLAWITILRKRGSFRLAFADFEPDVVASFTDRDVERLMADASIVRNRRKIEATITNARATIALRDHGGLDALVWSFAATDHPQPAEPSAVPAQTSTSLALAKMLKANGFAHFGPVTAYAAMQACGLVDDHLAGCFRRAAQRP